MNSVAKIPQILYKYRDWNNEFHKNILFEQEIFLSSASKFNDPFEGNIPFEYDEADLTPDKIFVKMFNLAKNQHKDLSDDKLHDLVFENQKKGLLFDPKHLETNRLDVKESIEESFGILCLTVNSHNFLMWSHYANSHSGFCVGFDSKVLYDTIDCLIGPVTYSDFIPKFRIFESINDFVVKLLGTKGTVWEYENEYRIVKSKSANKSFKIPKECIVEIILGCKMDFDSKMKIIEYAKKENPDCSIFEIKQSEQKFELIKEQIF